MNTWTKWTMLTWHGRVTDDEYNRDRSYLEIQSFQWWRSQPVDYLWWRPARLCPRSLSVPTVDKKKESLSYAFCNLTISKTISKFPRQLLKRWAFSLMKIKKGMYKCTCARGVCTLSMGDSFGFIMDFFCNKFLYHRVSCRKTNLYFCVLALEVCSHETF